MWHSVKEIINPDQQEYLEIYINNDLILERDVTLTCKHPLSESELFLFIEERSKSLNIDKTFNEDDVKSVIFKIFNPCHNDIFLLTSILEKKVDYAIEMLTGTNDLKGLGKNLICTYENMDENNKNATDLLVGRSDSEAVEYMFTNHDTGGKLTYSEMRSRSG